jgi:Polymorphic toxin system, DSP-PTPase phosphatase
MSSIQGLAGPLRIDGVINLAGPDVAEQVTTASQGLAYLHLAIAPGAAPGRSQLHTLADFMRWCTSSEFNVYVHDDADGGKAVTAAAMLLL